MIVAPVPLIAAKIVLAAGAAAFVLLYIPLWQRQYDAALLTQLLAAGLAMVTWRDADRLHGGTWARVLVGLAGLVCGYNVVTVLRLHPELILSPVGPGLWSVVGAPALLLAALLPRRPLTR